MRRYDPKKIPLPEVHGLLLGGVGPRPIALVSTLSKDGVNNLAPFSFFNAFGANPPTVAFSPARRGRDGTLKDTYQNLVDTKQCVIQCVTHAMVEQVNVASTEYGPEVDEFVKSGLTPIDAEMVKPKRVKESPFQMECVLKQMIPLGEGPASGNLAICEVVLFHVEESLFRDGVIDPQQIDLVARMSANYYARAHGESIFVVEKPIGKQGVGFDQLPAFIRSSSIYTGNDLGRLANTEKIPSREEVARFIAGHAAQKDATPEQFETAARQGDPEAMLRCALGLEQKKYAKIRACLERCAKAALEKNALNHAWCVALYAGGVK